MPDTVRAKFRCTSVELYSEKPQEVTGYSSSAGEVSRLTWPRVFKFSAQYDPSVPEDQRYAQATPSGTLTITVDNPAVGFTPGKAYYLEFTAAD